MKIAAETQPEPVNQWVTFFLEGEKYGVNVMQVQEVLRMAEIAPVPGAPPYVLGIINLRGSVVTVIDTRKRFGLAPAQPDDATRIIIVEVHEQVVGIIVDGVAEVVELHDSDIEIPPNVGNGENSDYIQGVYSEGEQLLILADLNKLLSESQWDERGIGRDPGHLRRVSD